MKGKWIGFRSQTGIILLLIEGFALINAGTIARGFGLQEIERVVVPVRVNLLLIGFEGEQDQQGLLQKSFCFDAREAGCGHQGKGGIH